MKNGLPSVRRWVVFASASNAACGVRGGPEDGRALLQVSFNDDFASMKPGRYVAGVPVSKVAGFSGATMDVVAISKDGRSQFVPVTLA